MTDRDAMLMAVVADPGDSTARNALADWLDDRGEHETAAGLRDDGGRWEVYRNYADPDPDRWVLWYRFGSDNRMAEVGPVPRPGACVEPRCVSGWARQLYYAGRWMCLACAAGTANRAANAERTRQWGSHPDHAAGVANIGRQLRGSP